jgi:hypothetical protein
MRKWYRNKSIFLNFLILLPLVVKAGEPTGVIISAAEVVGPTIFLHENTERPSNTHPIASIFSRSCKLRAAGQNYSFQTVDCVPVINFVLNKVFNPPGRDEGNRIIFELDPIKRQVIELLLETKDGRQFKYAINQLSELSSTSVGYFIEVQPRKFSTPSSH